MVVLKRGIAMDLSGFNAALPKLWPHGDSVVPGLIAGTIASAPAVFDKYKIPSLLVVAHIMGQFSEESGCGTEMMENMNYSAARLLKVFPTHFTHDQAIALQHQPRQIADHAYGGRMGNAPPPSDDGWNFRGQGFSQLTGKNNFVALAKVTGLDLIGHPELIRAPDTAFDCAVGDFIMCGCLKYAVADSLVGVSSMINVGHYVSDPSRINGYAMRKQWLGLWKHALGI